MKTKVTDQGLLIPKELLEGVAEVEIRQERNRLLVIPLNGDPIFQLGQEPLSDEVEDGSAQHDRYLYGHVR